MKQTDHVFFTGIERRSPTFVPGDRATVASSPALPAASARHAPRRAEVVQVDPFLSWLLARAGLDVHAYRPLALQRRLPACLRAVRASSTAEARKRIESTPGLLAEGVSAVLIGVSGLFRDGPVFDDLACRTLPGLLRKRGSLRVLSAGCSDGQELYSLAILLEEHSALEKSVLLGIDCRPEAIARARDGRLPTSDMEGLDPERRRHFDVWEDWAWASDELRRRTCWQIADLIHFTPSGPWDLILFRNVAIYLQPETQASVWDRLVGQLAPGGVLVTGRAERPPLELRLERSGPCTYHKAGSK